jgi:hypothetical protein
MNTNRNASLSRYLDDGGEFNTTADSAYKEIIKQLIERKNSYLRRLINSIPKNKLRSTYLLPDNEDYNSALNKLLACNALIKQVEIWRYPLLHSPFSEPEKKKKGPPSDYRAYLNRLDGVSADIKLDASDDFSDMTFFSPPPGVTEAKAPTPYALTMIPTKLHQLSTKQIEALQDGKLAKLFGHHFIQAFINRDSLRSLLVTNKVSFFSKIIFGNTAKTTNTTKSNAPEDTNNYFDRSRALNKAGKTKISLLTAELLTLRTPASKNLSKILAITFKLSAGNYFFELGQYISPQHRSGAPITTNFSPFGDFLTCELNDYAEKQQQEDFTELNVLLTQLLTSGKALYSNESLARIYTDPLIQQLLKRQYQQLYFSDQGKLNSHGKELGDKLKKALETTSDLSNQQDLIARQFLIDLFPNKHTVSRQSAVDADHCDFSIVRDDGEKQSPMQTQPNDVRLKHIYSHPFIQLVIQQRPNSLTDSCEEESMQSTSPAPSQTSAASS